MRAPFLLDFRRALGAFALMVSLPLLAFACGGGAPPVDAPERPPAPPPPPPSSVTVATSFDGIDAGATDAGSDADLAETDAGGLRACPAGMALVDTTYCPKVRQRCLKSEYNKPNHITICHRFAPGQTCEGKARRQRFCIDEYEYPNQAGAHPPVMVSWYDGAAACAAEGKRLCWESEWVSACEGPEKLPFPYGLSRDPATCNIDNIYVKPHLERVYSNVASVQSAELLGLDQSVASGEKPGCQSGFGVHDQTGNFDEWVNAEQDHKVSEWAGLKGGAWGHVRNACRPMTTSHPPEFTYYFISFRCCKDASPDPVVEKDPSYWKAPPQPQHAPAGGKISKGWTTQERGPNRPTGR